LISALIDILKKKNKLFKLFFDTHFEIVEIKSLIPSYRSDGSIYFPSKYILKNKILSKEEILKFIKEYKKLIQEMNKYEEKIL
jgi:hypothetical protein